MGRYGDSDAGAAGCVGLLLIIGIGSWVRQAFFPKTSGFLYWLLLVAFLVGACFALYFLTAVVTKISEANEKRVLRNKVCSHGIKGGEHLRVCESWR